MKITTKWLSAFLLPFVISTAWAAAGYVEGEQYTRLASPQPTSAPGKIEVVEMFYMRVRTVFIWNRNSRNG